MKFDNTVLTIGFDSEFQIKNDRYPYRVISFQLYIYETQQDIFIDLIREDRESIKLSEIITRIQEQYPKVKQITLIAHFAYAEISSLDNGRELLIGNGKMIISQKTPHGGFKKEHTNGVKVRLIDTMKLFPSQGSLENIGKLIRMEKIDLEDWDKQYIMDLYRQDHDLFQRYAMQDAKVAAHAYIKMKELVESEGWRMGNTVGSIGEAYIYDKLKQSSQHDLIAVTGLGFKGISRKSYDDETKRKKQENLIICDPSTKLFENVMFGGRNETYRRTILPPDQPVYDYDLQSAYTTLQSITPVWDTSFTLNYINADKCYQYLAEHPLAHGWVEIGKARHKKGIRFPIFIGRNDGTVFFCQGATNVWLTAKEFMVAYPDMIIEGGFLAKIYQPIRQESIISGFMQDIRNTRNRYPKEQYEFENTVFKDIGNSSYGKSYQGYSDKRGVDLSNSSYEMVLTRPIPTSRISNPLISTWTTGGIRALAYEILNEADRRGMTIEYWTTDGFATNSILPADMFRGDFGVWTKYVAKRLTEFSPEKPIILETKHFGNSWFSLKTRGYGMIFRRDIDQDEADKLMLSEKQFQEISTKKKDKRIMSLSGMQFEDKKNNDKKVSLVMEHLKQLKRFDITKFPKKTIVPIREYLKGIEYGNILSEQSYNFDWDFKRKPVGFCVVNYQGFDFVTFDTEPFKDEQEYLLWRKSYDTFNRNKGTMNKLLKIEHYHEFENYIGYRSLDIEGILRINNNTPIRILANFLHFKMGYGKRETARIINTTVDIVIKATKEEMSITEPVKVALLIQKWFDNKLARGEIIKPKKKTIVVLEQNSTQKPADLLHLSDAVMSFLHYIKTYKKAA
jgi:hypothetical protein